MEFRKRRGVFSVILTVLALIVLSIHTEAQSRNYESIVSTVVVGQVMDGSTGENINGAEVKIGGETKAVTNSGGEFIVEAIDPGTYTITVEAKGYQSWNKKVRVTQEGKKIEVRLTMA